MKLEGTYTFDAPREAVWQALLDPDVLAKTMPGCERLEQTGDNEYKGALKIRVGPVQGKFQGVVKLSDIKDLEGYRMEVDGKGAPGFVKGNGQVELEPQGSKTVIHYSGDAQVGGRIASVGQRLLDSSAKAITRQSLESLNKQIQARQQEAAGASNNKDGQKPEETRTAASPPSSSSSQPVPVLEGPSEVEFAMGVAKQVLDDLISHEKRMLLLAGALGVFVLILVLNWWSSSIARKVADEILERRH